jgi:hypothetical protein
MQTSADAGLRNAWQVRRIKTKTVKFFIVLVYGKAVVRSSGLLASNGIAISMDGKGARRDNVFVERLWRSIKYEEVYLRAYESVSEARNSIGRYLDFYNGRRPHQSLDDATPDQAYFNQAAIPLGGLTPGRRSTYRRGDSVQTSGTGSPGASQSRLNGFLQTCFGWRAMHAVSSVHWLYLWFGLEPGRGCRLAPACLI